MPVFSKDLCICSCPIALGKGVNENGNGLVRQYFSEGSDFSTMIANDLRRVERKLNYRLL